MPDKVAIRMIQNFIRENLEVGWSHLEDGRLDLARHHFTRALEQVGELESLSQPEPHSDSQPRLIDL